MKYVISHENQTIPVPENIAADEGKLRRALSSIIPGIAEARISYSDEKEGTKTITIAKQAGTKGAADPLAQLVECKGGKNQLIVCYEQLKDVDMTTMTAEEIITMDQLITISTEKGEEQHTKMKKGFERLTKASPAPSPVVILGF